jgi:hypothetical protein
VRQQDPEQGAVGVGHQGAGCVVIAGYLVEGTYMAAIDLIGFGVRTVPTVADAAVSAAGTVADVTPSLADAALAAARPPADGHRRRWRHPRGDGIRCAAYFFADGSQDPANARMDALRNQRTR